MMRTGGLVQKGRAAGAVVVTALALVACEQSDVVFVGDGPAPPIAVDARYYAGEVTVSWELSSQWNGETFRVYARRTTDPEYFSIAEVTSCSGGLCVYRDVNIVSGVSYEYYVAAVDPDTGAETASATSVVVTIPDPTPPPVPSGIQVVALDDANYVRWDASSRSANDFSYYNVYLDFEGSTFLLGNTDSEGFLDLVAENGLTYTYFVTAVDSQGHESGGSVSASGTPRPDYHGEWLWDYFDVPGSSGFRFQESEATDPIVDGDASARHFRFETDEAGWWLVPGPGTQIHRDAYATTSIKCGVAADASCTSVDRAPTSGYQSVDVGLLPQTTYVLRVVGDDGGDHYGAVRVEMLGFDQDDNAIMIFDWAYQLQPGNPDLAPKRAPAR